MTRFRLGLIGAGRIGAVHAKNIFSHPKLDLITIADVSEQAAAGLAHRFNADVMPSSDVFAESSIDAVVISSSTDTHADLMIRAAMSDKAIFCEKPIDLSIEKIDACLEAITQKKVPALIGYNRRYDPDFQQIKSKIEDRIIGDIELIIITSRDPEPPSSEYIAASGGLFRDMTIHDFDMARWLLNEEPCTVSAAGACLIDQEIHELGDIDTAVVTLQTASGKLCIINNSRRSVYGYDQRIEVFGSKGMLQAGNHREHHVVSSGVNGRTSARTEHFFLERYAEAYRREMDHFAEVLHGADPKTTCEDGRQSLILAEAALQSVETNSMVRLDSN